MSSEYSYDEEGQFFPYFLVTVAGLVTVPITYSLLRPSKGAHILFSRDGCARNDSADTDHAPRP